MKISCTNIDVHAIDAACLRDGLDAIDAMLSRPAFMIARLAALFKSLVATRRGSPRADRCAARRLRASAQHLSRELADLVVALVPDAHCF